MALIALGLLRWCAVNNLQLTHAQLNLRELAQWHVRNDAIRIEGAYIR